MGRRSADEVACRHGAEEARLDGSLEGAGSLGCCLKNSLSVFPYAGLAPGRYASYLISSMNFTVFIKRPILDDVIMEGRHPVLLLLSASCGFGVVRSDSSPIGHRLAPRSCSPAAAAGLRRRSLEDDPVSRASIVFSPPLVRVIHRPRHPRPHQQRDPLLLALRRIRQMRTGARLFLSSSSFSGWKRKLEAIAPWTFTGVFSAWRTL